MSIVTLGRGSAIFYAGVAIVLSLVSGCNSRDNHHSSNQNQSRDESQSRDGYEIRETEDAFAYRSSSPHATVLNKCVLVNTVADSCTLKALPLIGDGVTTPTVDDVMDRVLVTHNWMGSRFEQVLNDAPESLLTLFSSTTAILIGSKVRPSFYTRLNGAIQLDPVYLWTTLDEKRSISIDEDFRSDFGKDLQFWFLSRLANPDGSRLAPYYSLEDDSVRPIEDVKIPLQRLLFHELVHATDFMPRNIIADLDSNLSIYESIDSHRDEWLSNKLLTMHPLNSDTLREFAQVRYRGNEASSIQKSTSPSDIGELMATDGAIQFYSYSSQYEDLAQLVESVMMGHHYDSLTNVGFTQKPLNEDSYSCDELLVAWGQRNRLADPMVSVRARAATELVANLTPALTNFIESGFGNAELMTNQVHWCDNQAPTMVAASDLQARSAQQTGAQMTGTKFREMMQADSVVHPEGVYND
ncbi:MAG: hypothetical protein KTR35_06890 [Gammaproteobacteria bacterium]|nr:hypothetical protein [Gammaproteobacteria bacterium]